MSDQETKHKRSNRIHKSKSKGIKRYKDFKEILWRGNFSTDKKLDRRFEDRAHFSCGNSQCVMCANPRKTFRELTLKEKSDAEFQKLLDVDS